MFNCNKRHVIFVLQLLAANSMSHAEREKKGRRGWRKKGREAEELSYFQHGEEAPLQTHQLLSFLVVSLQ